MSAISRLLLIRFWPNFNCCFPRSSLTINTSQRDICPGNICPGFLFGPKIILVFSQISHLKKLLTTLPTRVFYSYMNCSLVFSQTPLWICLVIASVARVFDSFLYRPLVFSQILLRKLFITLPARIFNSFMYFPLVFSQTSFYRKLITTSPARKF